MAGLSQFIDNIKSSLSGQDSSVGLSIGSSSVKLVELKKSGKNWKLLHFGVAHLAENVIVNREIVNPIAVVDSLKTLVSQINLKNKNVACAISGNSVIIKRMTLDVTNPRELQDQVFWEAEQYLPFDVAEVVMDFQVLSKSKEGKTDIILVAAKKTSIDSYMSCIEDAGLKAKVMDVDFFALQTLFETNYSLNESEAVAIVDIGSNSLKLVVVFGGVPVFTKDSGIGGANLTNGIQKSLNLSFADAETLKIGGGPQGRMPQEVSDQIQAMSDNFATEIKRAIDFYNASSFGAPLSYILLTGGSSTLPGLSKVVEDATTLPTQILNPFNSITYDENVFGSEYLSNISSVAAIPIGLALRMGAK